MMAETTIKVGRFNPSKVEPFFTKLERRFKINNVTDSMEKYHYVVGSLNTYSLPDDIALDPYELVKKELLRVYSSEKRDRIFGQPTRRQFVKKTPGPPQPTPPRPNCASWDTKSVCTQPPSPHVAALITNVQKAKANVQFSGETSSAAGPSTHSTPAAANVPVPGPGLPWRPPHDPHTIHIDDDEQTPSGQPQPSTSLHDNESFWQAISAMLTKA